MAGKSTKMEVTYEDFSGGDWGVMNGSAVTRQNLPMFRGDNVQVYRNGTLGPRPGFKQLLTSGTKPTPEHSQHQFNIEAFQFIDLTVGPTPGFIPSLWNANISTQAAQAVTNAVSGTTFSGTPTANFTRSQTNWLVGNRTWNGVIFGANVALPGGALTQRSCVYRDRMYYYGNTATIFYSQPAVYSTVPNANQFTVAGNGTITDMFVFKNTLFILMSEGSGGTFLRTTLFSLTGASPSVGTLSEVARNTPMGPYDSVAVGATEVVGLSRDDGHLWVFNGTNFETINHLRFDPAGYPTLIGYYNPIQTLPINRFLMPVYIPGTDNYAIAWYSNAISSTARTFGILERVNGIWCYSSVPGNDNSGIYALASDNSKLYMKWSRPFPSSTSVFYFARMSTLDRPPTPTDFWAIDLETFPDSPNFNSVLPTVSLPPVVAPEGSAGVQVAKVMVDLDYWYTGPGLEFPTLPTLSCSLLPTGYWQESTIAALPATIAGTMNEAPSAWAVTTLYAPKQRRVVFTFPKMASAAAVYINFSSMRSIAIRRVIVSAELDVQSYPGGW